MSNTPQIDDKPFQHLLILLEAQGAIEQANSLRSILHGTWSSSSEMVGEVGLSIISIRSQLPCTSAQVQVAFESCLVQVKKAWPNIC